MVCSVVPDSYGFVESPSTMCAGVQMYCKGHGHQVTAHSLLNTDTQIEPVYNVPHAVPEFTASLTRQQYVVWLIVRLGKNALAPTWALVVGSMLFLCCRRCGKP